MASLDTMNGVQEVHLLGGSTVVGNVSHAEVDFEPRAYAKMIMHAAKYPHCAVNGLLLSTKRDTGKRAVLVDCVPLFHQTEGLTPMLEVALAQIESRCDRMGLMVSGYYHASRSFKDSTAIDVFSQRIADKIAENSVSKSNRTSGASPVVLVTIDNRKLSLVLESHALLVQMWTRSHSSSDAGSEGTGGRWRSVAHKDIGVDELTLGVTSQAVQRKLQKDLHDFDNHLDDLTCDYLNFPINEEVTRLFRH